MVEDDHIIKKSKNNKMPLNLARFLSDPRLYHLLLYCIIGYHLLMMNSTTTTKKAKGQKDDIISELNLYALQILLLKI